MAGCATPGPGGGVTPGAPLRLYPGDGERRADLVVLGHGFLREQSTLAGLARTLAAAGVDCATLDFTAQRPWDGAHLRNGLAMIRVADRLGARRVVYVGFSAGGLAALVAARNDPRARGVVTLDLVDAAGLGRATAAALSVPLVGLVGEPGRCNAHNGARLVYAQAPRGRLERIAGAGHCDFESPTDPLCEMLCGEADPALGALVRARASAAVLGLLGPETSTSAE
nr:alpha/beta hydrolase [Marichromatium bheemlicum]